MNSSPVLLNYYEQLTSTIELSAGHDKQYIWSNWRSYVVGLNVLCGNLSWVKNYKHGDDARFSSLQLMYLIYSERGTKAFYKYLNDATS